MAGPLRRLPLNRLVPLAVAATIVAFAAGSSSVGAINRAGKPVRWVVLVVLFGPRGLLHLVGARGAGGWRALAATLRASRV